MVHPDVAFHESMHIHAWIVFPAARCSLKNSEGACAPQPRKSASADRKLEDESEGRLPRPSHPTHMSIGGGHTNCFLRALSAGALTSEVFLRAPGDDKAEFGPIDKQRLMSADNGLARAATSGMQWRVIHAAAAAVPGLVEFGQAALNADAREGVGEVETIFLAHACVPFTP